MYVVRDKNGDIITCSSSYIICDEGFVEEIPDDEFDESMMKVATPTREDNVEMSEIEVLKQKIQLLQQALDDILINGGAL